MRRIHVVFYISTPLLPSSIFSHPTLFTPSPHLVLTSGLLTSLQLIQIPPANRQIALVLVHALAEIADVLGADLGRVVVGVHGVLAVGGLRDGLAGLGGGSGRGGPAAEEAADGVADGGADCDTAVI
jgi:hypothetical protein